MNDIVAVENYAESNRFATMIPGLYSLFTDAEFPDYWFSASILLSVACGALVINTTVECVFLSAQLEDLEKKTVPGPLARLFLGNFRFIQRCSKTHQLSRALEKVVENFGTIYAVRWPMSNWVVLNDRESVQVRQIDPFLSADRLYISTYVALIRDQVITHFSYPRPFK